MKSSLSAINNRRRQIVELIDSAGRVEVTELSERFKISAVTARRDLDILAEDGLVRRTFGGAEQVSSPSPVSVQSSSALVWHAIAKAAAALISPSDIVFINSSITASYVIEYIDAKHVSVVSNNTAILSRNRSANTTLILTGGQANLERTSLTGVYAINVLSKTVANKCILGVRGISVAEGITSGMLEETYVNQTMISQTSGPVIVVADHSKIGKMDSFFVGDIGKVNILITDSLADGAELQKIRDVGVQVILADTL